MHLSEISVYVFRLSGIVHQAAYSISRLLTCKKDAVKIDYEIQILLDHTDRDE